MTEYLFGYLDAIISIVIATVFMIFTWKRAFNDYEREQIKNSKIVKKIYNLF